MTLLILYLFLALGISFLCSVLEAVLLSTTPSFINVKAKSGNKRATLLRNLKKDVDRPLSAILTLNTIAHTVGAAGVGAQATKVFGEAYFGVISAVLTILILVFSEIIPKTLGANYWKKLALAAAQIIQYLVYITYPFVIISELITKVISSSDAQATTTSREELSVLANVGTEEGVFEESENKIIQGTMKLKTGKISEAMTHRTDIVALPTDATLHEVITVVTDEKFSRLPVYEETIDNIVGILHAKDLIQYLSGVENKDNFNVMDFCRTPYVAPSFKTMAEVFKDFQQNNIHIGIVIDELGGTDGIITLEDLLEEIVGEIFDEYDEVVNEIVKLDTNTFYVNGSIDLDEVVDYFNIDLPIEEYETLSGFMISQIGRIPDFGDNDSIKYAGWTFKIEEVDGRMISKVKVYKNEAETEASTSLGQ
ncbi:hemolysin family protein [Alteribacillus iranensis]|uniref:Putative hemolysin n=1 Tax=Alteribacillus iranensis TaxID=930128 RepID=A0A1I2BSD1_9BACI|nr:hemolysin family protein [Alteribacillus iranensis]SFE58985.1 putative hemolysin [Alteribacillus iranensis]